MNQPWIYMCSPSRSPLPPPSPSHPSGSSQCTSPEHLSRASSLDWRSVTHLIKQTTFYWSTVNSVVQLIKLNSVNSEVQLLSGILQGDSNIYLHVFQILFQENLLQDIKWSSLCQVVYYYTVICISWSKTCNLPFPNVFPLWQS